ncbi:MULTISPECIES: carbohydrate ABC transporter permease [Paenibacillus]|jgi:putative aldouronate transport system permease protein|uniref:Carbohydrate ABC transporter permease n=1 Tax=Paenibacillus baimaensis TaxID=2982185 RepID=A0ABT2UDH5_9BACL|nr:MULTISPECIES: carbohydrate ABC transporter permease [unclassified Paenibacillus]MCU6792652.1 carbohydrate ABC transporter permease [Paenibacillus sp. WQ 127069]OMF08791.1 ABC transporter permease [Paenibacillus sp. FSL H7-0331]
MNTFDSRGKDSVFTGIIYGLLIVSVLVILVPFFYVIASSFATEHEFMSRGFFIIPHEWTIEAYGYLLSNANFKAAFGNAVTITVTGTLINILLTSLMAYGLSKSWLRGRRMMNFLVLFTMIFAGGMIPTYLVVKELGLLNSYWALYLTTAIAPFNLIVMRSFFQNIPAELEESARIDGCSELRLFWQIVIPLSMPAIATFTLFYAVQNWNTYFYAILFLNNSADMPLQVFLRQMLIESDSGMEVDAGGFAYTPAVKMAAVLITAVPLLVIYPFMQKYFNKGMLMGSVKG